MATGMQQTVKLADLYTDLPTIIDSQGDEAQ
jgi:histidyl-tRNA synthetase